MQQHAHQPPAANAQARTPIKAALGKPLPPAPSAQPQAAAVARPVPGARPLPTAARPTPGVTARPVPGQPQAPTAPPPTQGEVVAAGVAVIAASEALVTVLKQETAAIRVHDRNMIASLQTGKNQAVGRYEQLLLNVRKLIHAAGGTVSGPDDFKQRLKQAAGDLDKAVAENVLALRAAKDANERLMTMIQVAATQQRPTGQGYTARGASARGYSRNMPPAMSLNGTF